MAKLSPVTSNSLAVVVAAALPFASVWLIGAGRTQESVVTLSTLAALALAYFLRARVAAYIIGALAAFDVAEWIVHSTYGSHVVQGRAAHLAVLVAATLGVICGAAPRFLRRSRATLPGGSSAKSVTV